jgi:hypothetical protein
VFVQRLREAGGLGNGIGFASFLLPSSIDYVCGREISKTINPSNDEYKLSINNESEAAYAKRSFHETDESKGKIKTV